MMQPLTSILCYYSMEPYVILVYRNLSAMDHILKSLQPHMCYTLEINALAQQRLTNVEVSIESYSTPRKYYMDLTAATYYT